MCERALPVATYESHTGFGLACVLATSHDILATLAFIAMLDLVVSLTVVAAILSVIGFSLNETIAVLLRESLALH